MIPVHAYVIQIPFFDADTPLYDAGTPLPPPKEYCYQTAHNRAPIARDVAVQQEQRFNLALRPIQKCFLAGNGVGKEATPNLD